MKVLNIHYVPDPHMFVGLSVMFPLSGRMQQAGGANIVSPCSAVHFINSEVGHELNLCEEQCRLKCKTWEMLIFWVSDGLWASFP